MISISKSKLSWIGRNRELLLVLISLLIQLPLAYFLGHYYDQRVFMATGYIVGSGGDPYKPIELVGVFSNPLLNGFVPSSGYPPPWSLVLGFVYRFSYGGIPDVFVYNFATKILLIAANIALAYLVKALLLNLKAEAKKADEAWLFLLINPFLILSTSAWGQIDGIAAVLCVASLFQLSRGYSKTSGFLLGASVAVKPVTAPLAPLLLLFSERLFSKRNLWYTLAFSATLLMLVIAPFFLLGWTLRTSPTDITSRLENAGGMSIFNVAELIQGSALIPSSLWFLGYLWVPALLIGYYLLYRNPPRDTVDLVCKSISILLVVFLSRSWLSEPNIIIILPLAVIAVALNRLDKRSLHLVWIVPLIFMLANAALPQLLFLVYPSVLDSLAHFDAQFGTIRLSVRFIVALFWSVVAWKMAIQFMKSNGTRNQPQKSTFRERLSENHEP